MLAKIKQKISFVHTFLPAENLVHFIWKLAREKSLLKDFFDQKKVPFWGLSTSISSTRVEVSLISYKKLL